MMFCSTVYSSNAEVPLSCPLNFEVLKVEAPTNNVQDDLTLNAGRCLCGHVVVGIKMHLRRACPVAYKVICGLPAPYNVR